MFTTIIKSTVLSIVFIYIVHQTLHYLTDTLTVPKTKDLVSIIEKKYDEIHKTLQQAPTSTEEYITGIVPTTTNLKDLPTHPPNMSIELNTDPPIPSHICNNSELLDMKSELQLFIKQSKYN
jgi:hypothetical protein